VVGALEGQAVFCRRLDALGRPEVVDVHSARAKAGIAHGKAEHRVQQLDVAILTRFLERDRYADWV